MIACWVAKCESNQINRGGGGLDLTPDYSVAGVPIILDPIIFIIFPYEYSPFLLVVIIYHFYSARALFRRCTLESLFMKPTLCTHEQAVTLQKFSVIVSEGGVYQVFKYIYKLLGTYRELHEVFAHFVAEFRLYII